MKFNYQLQRLCGAYYGHPTCTDTFGSNGRNNGSNLLFSSDGNVLVSSVSNRVQLIDLKSHTVRTLPMEARSNIATMAMSPDDALLVVVDVQNYAMLVNVKRGVVLHKQKFKRKVRQALFSPCGSYLAITQGKHIQVWYTPLHRTSVKDVSPMILHRTYTGFSSDAVQMSWSTDSSVIVATSRDCTTRIWTVHTTRNYQPVTLSGHKTSVIGAYFVYSNASTSTSLSAQQKQRQTIDSCYTISEDGALVTWKVTSSTMSSNNNDPQEDIDLPPKDDFEAQVDDAVDFFSGGDSRKVVLSNFDEDGFGEQRSQAHDLVDAMWSAKSRHYFHQEGGRSALVTSCSYCPRSQILAVGFSTGVFGLYELPSVSNIHTLSIGSNQLIKSCILNNSGDWLAVGCPTSQQILVWEWRSESYILKQRGHAYGMTCMAYSPDGIVIATGGEDGKLKLWNASSGFCYVTFPQGHQAPITAVKFANASVVLSAGLDGTVRAHDLHRYRTFKTLTTPTPVQFSSLAVDPSGELVAAGSMDPFHIYTWNLQTGSLLDVLTGHEGPVCGLDFSSADGTTLASASWDGTVKLWNVFKSTAPSESLSHTTDVVCVTIRPDGKEVCTGTIGGLLSIWDVENAKLKYEIDGRRDIVGGRKINDRMTSNNNASSRYFTSVCYSADGMFLLAGGNSKFVCIYHVSQQMLLKKFQVTFNRSLDGILDELNSKKLTDYGPIHDELGSDDETTYNAIRLPGARRGDDGSRTSRVEVLTRQVSFSSTGREWAVVSGEGLHVYSLDDDMLFDPISLSETITPGAVESKLASGQYGTALRMAVHLNEFALIQQVLESTPYASIPHVVRTSIEPGQQLERLMQCLSKVMERSPHIEFYLQWCLEILQTHGLYMEKQRGSFMRAFRAMHRTVQMRHDELKTIGDENRYTLEVVEDQARLLQRSQNKS